MKWFFSRAKSQVAEGIVGVWETQTGIAAAHVIGGEHARVKSCFHTSVGSGDQAAKQVALQQYVLEKGLANTPCSYVLSSDYYNLNLVEAPSVPPEEVVKAISWLLRDLINYPIEEAVVDTFQLPFVRARDNTKMLYAVSCKKSTIPKIESLIKHVGLQLSYIDIPELALRNLIGLHPEYSKMSAFVQLNQQGGRLILCHDKNICITRSFSLNIEDLSTEEGLHTLDAIGLEIQRSFDYVNSVFRQTISNIVVLAPTSIDKMLVQASIKNTLGSEVCSYKISEYLTVDNPLSEEDESECLLAIGSALRCMEDKYDTAD